MTQMQVELALETESRTLDAERCCNSLRQVIPGHEKAELLDATIFIAETKKEDADGSEWQVGGMTMITTERSPLRGWMLQVWLQGVYTFPSARGKGLFKALFARCKQAALMETETGSTTMSERVAATAASGSLRLVVDKANKDAIASYAKLGMRLQPASRVFRWTRNGAEPPRADRPPHIVIAPLSDEMSALCSAAKEIQSGVRLATEADDVANTIVPMQVADADKWLGLKVDPSVVSAGFVKAIRSESSASPKCHRSQVLVLQIGSSIVASCSVFQEYCDWRNGLVAWVTCFSTCSAHSCTPRAALFLAFIYALKARCAEEGEGKQEGRNPPLWCGIRFEADIMREQQSTTSQSIVPAALAEGFIEEDDRFMQMDVYHE